MIRLRHILAVITIIVALGISPDICRAAATLGKNLQAALSTGASSTELSVIITFSDKISPVASFSGPPKQRRGELVRAMRRKAADSQQPLKTFLENNGIRDIRSLWIINGMAIKANPSLINTISRWPGVEEIRTNGTITAPVVTTQAVAGTEWNISAVDAPPLWGLDMTGTGVVIASLDTGIDGEHPDLKEKWRGWTGLSCDPLIGAGTKDWFDPHGEHLNCPYDKDGHGTAVAGVMVGGTAGGTAIGVAPDATWIAAKIFNDAGNASYDAIHRSFEWVLDPDGDGDTSDAPDIVNNSWGLNLINQCTTEFQPDIQLLKTAGIAVVFSSGNTGPDPLTSTSPANYPESLAVGATSQDGTLGSFSGRGPTPCPSADQLFPHLSAPGVGIKTSDLTLGGVILDSYVYGTGTSFAAPHVSGMMALLLEPDGFPASTVAELEEALKMTASDLGLEGPDNDFGYGQLNGLAAFRRLAGQPHLAVYDPKPPEHDLLLDFGSISAGTDIVQEIVIRNNGGTDLILAANDWSTVGLPFTVTSDTCSAVTLTQDNTCRLSVQFSPAGAGSFNETLSFFSNDPDQNPVVVTLAGTGAIAPTAADLQVTPSNRILAFGSVPPGITSGKTLTITNTGEELLDISQVDDSLLATPFTMTTDNCTGAILALNESCDVTFTFSPTALGVFQDNVDIISDNPSENPVVISLSGTGNNPPLAASLLFPVNGTSGLDPTSVTFSWLPASEPDGDQITATVVLTEITGASRTLVSLGINFPAASGLSGGIAGILLLGSIVFSYSRRRSAALFFGIMALGAVLFSGCGGGSDSVVSTTSAGNTFTVTGLKSTTTYSWKVVSTDTNGGSSETGPWSFTTR